MQSDDCPSVGSGPADPRNVKEAWLDVVVPAERAGRLDKIPARKPVNLRERSQAKAQNHAVTRHTFGGFGANYDTIQWDHARPCPGGVPCPYCGVCNPVGSAFCGRCRRSL